MTVRSATKLLQASGSWFKKVYQPGKLSVSLRYSSTFARQWSTPLARTIAQAIEVRSLAFNGTILTVLDYWTHLNSGVHAAMPYISRWRLLHDSQYGSRPVRSKRGFHYFPRNITDLWRATRSMDGSRVDCTGQAELWSTNS